LKLFASLYLDEDVSILVADILRARGFDVITARDEKMLGRNDPAQLEKAISLHRCIFTHNRLHYEELHQKAVLGKKEHFGIIIGTRRNPYELARRIATLLDTLASDEIENQLLYV
jgi:hypothetical protein